MAATVFEVASLSSRRVLKPAIVVVARVRALDLARDSLAGRASPGAASRATRSPRFATPDGAATHRAFLSSVIVLLPGIAPFAASMLAVVWLPTQWVP